MIRLLLLLIIITGLGMGAAWMADHPGSVTLYWFDYRIDTSVAFLLTLLAVAMLVLAYIFILLRAIILAPAHFSERRQLKHYHKGMAELTHGIAALAAADIKGADTHTRKAERLLGQTPLTLLLAAQVARGQGDEAKTRLLLTQMLEHKETEFLAARSLADAASKQQMFTKALPLAQRATAINPREKSSAVSVIGLNIRLGGWQEALQAISKSAWKGALNRRDKHYYRCLVYLLQGMKLLDDGQAEAALTHARAALKQSPEFAPATVFAARTLVTAGKPHEAVKLALKYWNRTPHPELAASLRVAMAKEPKEKQMKYARKLAAALPGHVESDLAMAETAIKFKEWGTARASLKAVLAKEESMRACKLMAYVEQGEFSDFDAAGRWLARSTDAHPDPAWTCHDCQHTAEHWNTHCDHCSGFDTMEWKEQKPLVFAATGSDGL